MPVRTDPDATSHLLPVVELFQTIQGEAAWTGTPAVFVRLQGCNVACSFCDTKYTWELNPQREISLAAMLAKEAEASSYAAVGVSTLVSTIKSFEAKHVVITGGEPCMYDLTPLTQALKAESYTVQIETSGTEPVRAAGGVWITCSPKIGMPGGLSVLPDVLAFANEIKVPVGKMADVERFNRVWTEVQEQFADIAPTPTIWLQPLSTSEKATRLCIDVATKRGWRISLQTHKFIGVR